MTFRAKPAAKRGHHGSDASRRNLYLNLAFGGVVVLALLILAAAAAASWYGDHLGAVAKVDGVTITKDDYSDRSKIEQFRIVQAEARIRDDFQAGRLTQAERDQKLNAVDQQRQQIDPIALERLVDATLQAKLAAAQGVTVTDADIDAQLTVEATRPEERHVWAIVVAPQLDANATIPTDAEKAAAKAKAERALADLKAGKAWADVAKSVSTDPSKDSGGDLGWMTSANPLDKPLSDAVFAAQPNTPTDVIQGADGTSWIGRVTEIVAASVDSQWQQKISDAGIGIAAYRRAVKADVTRDRLEKKLIAQYVDSPTTQRRVSEIYIAASQRQGGGDEVKAKHVLFSPNHITDRQKLAALPQTDPGWAKAQADAQAAYDKLKGLTGDPAKLEQAFTDMAKQLSDEPGAKTSGGDLPYFTQAEIDPGFGAAIFKVGLKKDDLIGPVKSQFGWHVILFVDRRPPAETRAQGIRLQLAEPNADFATIARQSSEGPEASKGGDLGWVARYQLQKDLESAIFATQVGGISDVVTVKGDGFYIFKVWEEQTRAADGQQADTLRKSIFSNWYGEQKAKADIWRDPAITGAAAAAAGGTTP